jgi:hypothetical protein
MYRKPYFLQLKRFLRQEGVTGAESTGKLKVYPPRQIISVSPL